MDFSVWILSLSGVFKVCSYFSIYHSSFLFMAEYHSTVGVDRILLSVHLLTDIWIISTFFAITNNVATIVYKFLCSHVFIYLGYIYLAGGLLGHITLFKLLSNHQTIFQSGCIILHSHRQSIRVLISLHLLLSVFWIIAILSSMK